MDMFEIRNIDGVERALFHLDERQEAFHATDKYYEKYTAF